MFNSNKKYKIGIIGLGMVGGALFHWLKNKKNELFCYDKFKNIGKLDDLNTADIIFICLPTPYNQKFGYDIKSIEESISFFKNPKIFVIKSTVLPGTTNYFQKKYKIHKFLHNPEFLREKYALKDFITPDLQLVGYTPASKNYALKVLNLLPKAKYSKIVEAKVSELSKLSINSFLAIKVIFANQIFDLCKKLKIHYEEIREILENEPRLGKSHFDVNHSGYRGFGGKCLPKDLKALIKAYENLKINPKLFNEVWNINYKYLKNQKLLKILQNNWLQNKS